MDIATGTPETHPTPLPIDASNSPGVQQPTATAGLLTPADQGPVRDLTGERLSQLAGYEQDITAAMHSGMAAETDRRSGYAADMVNDGPGQYGDLMDLPSGYPDAGTVGGLTDPAGNFYTPPREGAPETYTAAGNEP
jgi:hypothetical protein